MQSHGGQVRHLADIPRWGDDVMDSTSPTGFARRPLPKAAVLGRRDETDIPGIAEGMDKSEAAGRSLLFTIIGRILDVSPHILVLLTERGEERCPPPAAGRPCRR